MTNYWRRRIAGNATSGQSAMLVAELVRLARDRTYAPPPWIATSQPVYRVPADQPLVKVTQRTRSGYRDPVLNAIMDAVPLPDDAVPSRTRDSALCLFQPDTGLYREFWVLQRADDGSWSCEWGGGTDDYASSSGRFGIYGTSASGLEVMGGLVTADEVRAGAIEHRVALWLPDVRRGQWANPAARSDGSDRRPRSIPYGARFQLDPAFDVSTISDPIARMLALAAQLYGLIVRDRTHYAVQFDFERGELDEDGVAVEWAPLMTVSADRVMQHFPWEHLLLRPMELLP